MTNPTPLPPTRAQLLESLAATETKLVLATREQYSAEHTYREARAIYSKYGGDALYDEADKVWGIWNDKQDERQALANEVETLKAHLLGLDNALTEAAALREAREAWVSERLDDLTLEIETTENLLPQFSSVYSITSLTERLTAKRLAAGCLARQYLNSQEWQNLMNAQDEPEFVTETDRPLFFVNGAVDEAGAGDGQDLEEIY